MEKNLQNEEALAKFRELAKEINICMFITDNKDQGQEHTRPMATIDVEEDGTLWFFTDKRSIKVDEARQDDAVHLTYAHPGKDSYLDVWGSVTVESDRGLIREKWSPIVKAWFPEGPEDPNLALLRVRPTNVYYWDAENGKMVQFLKMAAAAVTSQPRIAEGASGKLDI